MVLCSTSFLKFFVLLVLPLVAMVESQSDFGGSSSSLSKEQLRNLRRGGGRRNPPQTLHRESRRERKPAADGDKPMDSRKRDSKPPAKKPLVIRGRSSIGTMPSSSEIAACPTGGGNDYADLMAGQFHDVGNVWITKDSHETCLVVDFDDSQYGLSDIHIYYACTPPSASAAGQFTYNFHTIVTDRQESWCFTTLSCGDGNDDAYMAFHAGDARPLLISESSSSSSDDYSLDVEAIHQYLQSYNGTIQASLSRSTSLWTIHMNGTLYDGWCLDSNQVASYREFVGKTNVDIYALTDPTLQEVNAAAQPDNAIVNLTSVVQLEWLVHHVEVDVTTLENLGGESPYDCPATVLGITEENLLNATLGWREVQMAIWKFVEPDQNYPSFVCLGNATCHAMAEALVECAQEATTAKSPNDDSSSSLYCQAGQDSSGTVGIAILFRDEYMKMSFQEILIEVPLHDIPGACRPDPTFVLDPHASSNTAWAVFDTPIDYDTSSRWGASFCKL